MSFYKQTRSLVEKELQLDFKNLNALSSIALYVLGSGFVCYMGFNLKRTGVPAITWNTLFWVLVVFNSIFAVSKSFKEEHRGRMLYYFQLIKPEVQIVGKVIYNSIICLVINLLSWAMLALLLKNPVQDHLGFGLAVVLGSVLLASILTVIAAIANKSSNNGMLMPILSFPLMIPSLVMLIKLSKNAVDGLDLGSSADEFGVLSAILAIVVSTGYILYPYLWKN